MKLLWLLIPAAYLLGQRNARSEELDYQAYTAKSGEQWRLLPRSNVSFDTAIKALDGLVQSYHVEGSYLVITFAKDFTFTIPGIWFQSANKVREAA